MAARKKTLKKLCVDCHTEFAVEKDKDWALRCYPCWKIRDDQQGKRRVEALMQEIVQLRQQVTYGGGDSDQWRRLEEEITDLKAERQALQHQLWFLERQATRRGNGLNGQNLADHLPPDMMKRLLMLCHPDKHGGSAMSTRVTQWLLERRP